MVLWGEYEWGGTFVLRLGYYIGTPFEKQDSNSGEGSGVMRSIGVGWG